MLSQLSLSGVWDLSRAADLKAKLLEKLQGDAPALTVNLAEVTTLDTACIQVLLVAKLATGGLTIVNCSDNVLQQLDRSGATRLLL